MADLVNRAQMRKELPRLSGQAFIQSQEVLTSSFRRIGAGDYRLAIDDVALLAAINAFATQEKAEDDETQTKLDTINASLGTINTSITTLNANLTTLLNEVKTALGGIDASIDETTAAVNDVNEDTEAISTKVDTANRHLADLNETTTTISNKLDPIQEDVDAIRNNTTPVVVDVELTGMEGLTPFEVMPREGRVMGTLYYGDGYRGLVGNAIMSNGAKKRLGASDFSADKIEAPTGFDVDANGDIKVGCGGELSGSIIYHYNDAISFTVDMGSDYPRNFTDIKQTHIDLAHIEVGQTIDFTTDDLTGTDSAGHEVSLPTITPECQNVNEVGVVWESSTPDVLAPVEGQPGKFSAIKAGTSTITYKYTQSADGSGAPVLTATFNAVVEGE